MGVLVAGFPTVHSTTLLIDVLEELVKHLDKLGCQEVEFLTNIVGIIQPTLHIITITTLTFPTVLFIVEIDPTIIGFITQDLIELVRDESHLGRFVHETKILDDVGTWGF